MGLLPDEFYNMTWKDFSRAADGYWLRHIRYMQGIRRLSFFIVRMNSDPKHARKIKEQKLFWLPTDPPPVEVKPVKMPKAEFEAMAARYKNRFNKMKNG